MSDFRALNQFTPGTNAPVCIVRLHYDRPWEQLIQPAGLFGTGCARATTVEMRMGGGSQSICVLAGTCATGQTTRLRILVPLQRRRRSLTIATSFKSQRSISGWRAQNSHDLTGKVNNRSKPRGRRRRKACSPPVRVDCIAQAPARQDQKVAKRLAVLYQRHIARLRCSR